MTNAEATITENAATVAEQGAHVAPEKAATKKGATQKKGVPKGQKRAKGKAKASPKKEAKAGKKAKPAHACRHFRIQPAEPGAATAPGLSRARPVPCASNSSHSRRNRLQPWLRSPH